VQGTVRDLVTRSTKAEAAENKLTLRAAVLIQGIKHCIAEDADE